MENEEESTNWKDMVNYIEETKDVVKVMTKLEKRIEELKEENESAELTLNYSMLADLCKLKVNILRNETLKLIDIIDREKKAEILKLIDEIVDWEKKAEEYKQLELRLF